MSVASAKKFKALCESLELERNDRFYLDGPPKETAKVVTKPLEIIPERFKRIYVHAGRYSSGDRDKMATHAWLEYDISEDLWASKQCKRSGSTQGQRAEQGLSCWR